MLRQFHPIQVSPYDELYPADHQNFVGATARDLGDPRTTRILVNNTDPAMGGEAELTIGLAGHTQNGNPLGASGVIIVPAGATNVLLDANGFWSSAWPLDQVVNGEVKVWGSIGGGPFTEVFSHPFTVEILSPVAGTIEVVAGSFILS